MREEFKASFVSKYVLDWWGLLVVLFVLWIVLFRSTVSIGWRIGYAAVLIFLLGNGIRWIIKYHKDLSYRVIVTDESITGELFNKKMIEIRWEEIGKIVEEPSGFTSMFFIYSLDQNKKIWIAGSHLLNYDALEEIIHQKIKEHNIPYQKITRWI
jgi:hypothetical protein